MNPLSLSSKYEKAHHALWSEPTVLIVEFLRTRICSAFKPRPDLKTQKDKDARFYHDFNFSIRPGFLVALL